jgi:hypothetical protein
MASPLKTIIRSLTETHVMLSLEDGQELRVPLSTLEGSPKVGAEAYLIVALPGSEDAGRQPLARDLLNQLLGKSN